MGIKQSTPSYRHLVHPFPPVLNKECRILILGSAPSVRSVLEGFYYMHPQNRFWPVMSCLLDESLVRMSSNEKRYALLAHHVALYDAVYACDIIGSSDASMQNVIPADLEVLIQDSDIEHIFCNGKRAYQIAMQYNPALRPITTSLPSTSPANAAYSTTRLVEEWKIITDVL